MTREPRVSKKKHPQTGTNSAVLQPLNPKQKQAVNAIRTCAQTILIGPAGVGKTYLLGHLAAEFYAADPVRKIVISRPNEPAGRSIGYFPGTLLEKMAPWTAELFSVMSEVMGKGTVETGIKNDRIEIVPFETMRGRSFRNSFVILDEAQNSTEEQALMWWTRHAEGSKAVMNGDLMQTDVGYRNGLRKSIQIAQDYNLPVSVVEFDRGDIVRSGYVGQWIDAWERDQRDQENS